MLLFPAISILKAKAMNIEADFHNENTLSTRSIKEHKYIMESINSAIAILEKQDKIDKQIKSK